MTQAEFNESVADLLADIAEAMGLVRTSRLLKENAAMKVFVVMGNDFPEAVYAVKAQAREFCDAQPKDTRPRIHWRIYEFDVRFDLSTAQVA